MTPHPVPNMDALWKGALYDEVDRATHSGAPLSLLVVELADADRMAAVEGRMGVGTAVGRFARAVRSACCLSMPRGWTGPAE